MLTWAIAFMILALIAGVLGLTGLAGVSANIAWRRPMEHPECPRRAGLRRVVAREDHSRDRRRAIGPRKTMTRIQ